MKDRENFRYFQFPLSLLKQVHTDPKRAFEDIISFSIVHFVLKIEITREEAAKQAVYNYYRGDCLSELKSQFKELYQGEDLSAPGDLVLFDKIFLEEQQETIQSIVNLFESNPELEKSAVLNCQLSRIDIFFKLNGPSKDTRLSNYKRLINKIQEFENDLGIDAYPTIEVNLLFDLLNQNSPDLFAAYIAIRSLHGKKDFILTTRNVILMRMFGAKSQKALDYILKDKKLLVKYDKYARTEKALRYNFDKLFDSLLKRGLLKSKIYVRSVSRQIFMSCRIDYKELEKRIIHYASKRNHKSLEFKSREIIEMNCDPLRNTMRKK